MGVLSHLYKVPMPWFAASVSVHRKNVGEQAPRT